MSKQDTASYLVSLSQLMKDQDAAGGHLRSQTLAREYNRTWDELVEAIRKDEANETRTSANPTQRTEAGADRASGSASGGGTDRPSARQAGRRDFDL